MEPSFKADLNEYISQCKIRLERILQTLNWSEAATLKDFQANSIASTSSRDMTKPCPTFKSTFPTSCVNANSVVLDTQKLQDLLQNNTLKAPANFVELQSNFSREQKLKLYEHAIENTKKLENNVFEQEGEGEISLADILAQKKREEKKKKRRFRKSKPTHIEEVRSVVQLQMQALEQFLDNKTKSQEKSGKQRISQEKSIKQRMYAKQEEAKDSSRLNDCHRRDRCSEMYTESYEIKKYLSSNSKESSSHQRSSYEELSGKRKRSITSHDRERRYSRSSNEDVHYERKKHKSKTHHKSKEKRKHKRRSRSSSRKVSKHKHHHSNRRSKSPDKNISKGRELISPKKGYGKYTSRKESVTYSKHSKEKYEKSSRDQKSSSTKKYRK